jgi:hypothetical protein
VRLEAEFPSRKQYHEGSGPEAGRSGEGRDGNCLSNIAGA